MGNSSAPIEAGWNQPGVAKLADAAERAPANGLAERPEPTGSMQVRVLPPGSFALADIGGTAFILAVLLLAVLFA